MAEETVLIVDDDRMTGRLCQHLLSQASYQVIAAADPLDGLRVLEKQHVDLLLSDIRMPEMDGFDLINRAKKLQPDLPVLVMTGPGNIETAIQALHRGIDGLILKPFKDSSELVQAVQRILAENRQRRDLVKVNTLRPLFDVTERLLAETSPHTLEKLIIETVSDLLQTTFACIYRFDSACICSKPAQVLQNPPAGACDPRIEALRCLSGQAGAPVVVNASGPGSMSQFQPILKEAGLDTLMIAPVERAGKFVFCAGRKTGSDLYSEADLEMFVILARQAAVALENAHLVSELKNYVAQVDESNRALIQAEKMAAVGRLMASLAHEINNPLQAVRNCLHLASREGLNEQQRSHYLELTGNELDRLVNTVRDMLDFYRPVGVENEQIDMARLIDQVLALVKPQLHDLGIQVHVNAPEEIRAVRGVSSQLKQVIFNLMINAIDALAENPAEDPGRDKEIWIDIVSSSRGVSVAIEDSGPGIPPPLREQIFEPFVSTKKNGTGLGLAVSFGILEKHLGRLALAPSRYGAGACFVIELPVEVNEDYDQSIDR